MMVRVENGVVAADLIATKYKDDIVSHAVEKQRPLCPYTQMQCTMETAVRMLL